MPNDTHRTPKWLIDYIKVWKRISLDPCPASDPHYWFAVHNYEKSRYDGLVLPWKSFTFCNPPYSRGNLIRWIYKAYKEYHWRGIEIILLVPGDFSTGWWESMFCESAKPVYWCAINKRVKFEGSTDASAKFPSALVYYGDDTDSFIKYFSRIGRCHRSC